MRQVEPSCECWRAIYHRIQRQPLCTWQHLAARTMSCLARLPPARHRHSGCSHQCLRDLRVLEILVPLQPRSTPTRRVFQSSTAASQKGAYKRRIRRARVLPLRLSCVEKDSMRKTTLANLETKTLKAFRNISAHYKNADAKISDWVSYIPVVWARICSVVDQKTDEK